MLGQEEQQVEKKRERARCWCFTQCLYSSLAHVVVTGAPKKIERRQTHGGFTKNSFFFRQTTVPASDRVGRLQFGCSVKKGEFSFYCYLFDELFLVAC